MTPSNGGICRPSESLRNKHRIRCNCHIFQSGHERLDATTGVVCEVGDVYCGIYSTCCYCLDYASYHT